MKETSWLAELWFSPSWVFMKYIHLLRQMNPDAPIPRPSDEERVRKEGRFKKVRETLAAANLALAVQKQTNHAVHLQLSLTDPPDFFLLQPTPENPNLPWITYVEHTSFGTHHSQTSLADQLEATKLKRAEEYSCDYLLLIEMEEITEASIQEVQSLIDRKNITYKVWLMQGRMQDDDQHVRVVTLNSPFKEILADFKTESGRFPNAPAAFEMRLSEKDTRPARAGQRHPWPDPLGGELKY